MISNNLLKCISLILITNIYLIAQNKVDALALYKEGKYKETIAITEQELSLNPNNLDARVILIWSLIGINDYKRAEQEALQGLIIKKHDSRIIEILAEAYFFQAQYNNAIKYFQKYINLDPNGIRIFRVYVLIGDSFAQLNRYNEADFAYESALRFSPNNKNLLLKIAKSRIEVGNIMLAKEALNEILRLYPNTYEAIELLHKLNKKDNDT